MGPPSRSSLLLYGVLLIGFLGGLVGCDFTESAETDSLVVETFIETNRPLPTVLLRQTRPLEFSTDTASDAATGAQVQLVLDEEPFLYDERAGQPGQYEPNDPSRTVPPGVSWELRVQWKGEMARAAGIVPRPITLEEICVTVPEEPILAIKADSLRRDSLDIPTEERYIYQIDVALKWKQNDGGLATDTTRWVRTQLRPDTSQFASRLVDRFLEPVEVRREDQFGRSQDGSRRWTGVYAVPVDTSTSPLPQHRLETTVVRGDSTFGDFARTRADAGLREPLSNIDGGLGVALAVAIDSVVHTVETPGQQCRRPSSTMARRNPTEGTDVHSSTSLNIPNSPHVGRSGATNHYEP